MNEKSSQFLNPATAVSDAIDGMLLMRNNLKKLSNADVVVRSDIDEIKTKQVTLISGGGSGKSIHSVIYKLLQIVLDLKMSSILLYSQGMNLHMLDILVKICYHVLCLEVCLLPLQ